jgi:hypothetical protein
LCTPSAPAAGPSLAEGSRNCCWFSLQLMRAEMVHRLLLDPRGLMARALAGGPSWSCTPSSPAAGSSLAEGAWTCRCIFLHLLRVEWFIASCWILFSGWFVQMAGASLLAAGSNAAGPSLAAEALHSHRVCRLPGVRGCAVCRACVLACIARVCAWFWRDAVPAADAASASRCSWPRGGGLRVLDAHGREEAHVCMCRPGRWQSLPFKDVQRGKSFVQEHVKHSWSQACCCPSLLLDPCL